jgi:hypothetical protein
MKNIFDYTPEQILDAAKTALEIIKANPETWDQSEWHCETTACLGGWMDIILNVPYGTNPEGDDFSTVGRYVLLNDKNGDNLFWGLNSLEDLEEMMKTATVIFFHPRI